MQRLFDALTGTLRAFVTQRDDVALLVRSPDGEAALALKALEQLEDDLDAAMVWTVSEAFADAGSFVRTAVATFAVKHGTVRLAMLRRGDDAPWPELPPTLLDEACPPVERLRELMVFSRALLPLPDDMVVAWGLFPSEVHDPAGWAALLGALLPHRLPDPWCRRLRVVARALPDDPLLPHALAVVPRVRWYDTDLGPAAITAALEDEAADPATPLPQRMRSLLTSAVMDFTHQRHDAALQKYGLLLKFAAGTRDATLAALTLNQVGELHARLGNRAQAGRCFEAAIDPALAAPGPPVPILLNLALNLGNLRLSEERWEEAEGWYDTSQQLATVLRDADTKLHAMDNLATCQYMQRKFEAAATTWTAGATVAGELQLVPQRQRMLGRLHFLYGLMGDAPRQSEVAHQIASLLVLTPLPGDVAAVQGVG